MSRRNDPYFDLGQARGALFQVRDVLAKLLDDTEQVADALAQVTVGPEQPVDGAELHGEEFVRRHGSAPVLDLLTEIRDLLAAQASPDGGTAGRLSDSDGDRASDDHCKGTPFFEGELADAAPGAHQIHQSRLDVRTSGPFCERPGVPGVVELHVHLDLESSTVGTSEATSAAGSVSADSAAPVSEQEREFHRRIAAANAQVEELRRQNEDLVAGFGRAVRR